MDWLSIITEKKVEIWHSLLRFHINIYYTGNDIRNTAIALVVSSTATVQPSLMHLLDNTREGQIQKKKSKKGSRKVSRSSYDTISENWF